MSGTSSSGLPGNPQPLAKQTVVTLGAGLAGALAKSASGEQSSLSISPQIENGGAAFVRSLTNGAVNSSTS
jgi:hypothetical protein